MANKKFYGKRMVPEYLITKLETLEPSTEYTAGTGIEINEDEISIDDEVVATKTDLEDYELKSEAFSGSYNDLTNKPDLSIYAQSSNLSTVATSGNYDDLTNKPTIPTVTSSITQGSTEAVTSGAVYDAIGDIETLLAAI